MGLRESILDTNDRRTEPVEVPEWKCTVYIGTMTARERDQFEADLGAHTGKPARLDNIRSRLLVRVLCDEAGKRIFTDADAEGLGNHSAVVLSRLWDHAMQLNGLAGSVETAAGKP